MKSIPIGALLLAATLATTTHAAEPCETLRPAQARQAPQRQAAVVAELQTAARMQCWQRQGGWQQIMLADGRLAWLPRYQVRRGAPVETADSGLRARLEELARRVTGLFAGWATATPRARDNVTATIGIRSLNPGQTLAALPDPAQLGLLERHAATPEQARRFADSGGLRARRVEDWP